VTTLRRLPQKIAVRAVSTRCSFVLATYLVILKCNAALLRQGLSHVDKTVEIVILAMIAAFLGLRLYSVLGRRAEHEEEVIQGPRPAETPRAITGEAADRNAAPARMPVPGVTPAIERGLREIAAADRRFDITAFVEGAKGAYRMILEAFWKGDKETLGELCDRDVYEGFVAAIAAREAAGEVLDNRLVRIEEAVIVSAAFQAPMARISIRFAADIAAVTRNAAGQVVAGSLDDAVEARDLWTFSRNVTSASPDWLLDETDEA
jgi:predicted lipid-binding transport protein (Tim44 family)